MHTKKKRMLRLSVLGRQGTRGKEEEACSLCEQVGRTDVVRVHCEDAADNTTSKLELGVSSVVEGAEEGKGEVEQEKEGEEHDGRSDSRDGQADCDTHPDEDCAEQTGSVN